MTESPQDQQQLKKASSPPFATLDRNQSVLSVRTQPLFVPQQVADGAIGVDPRATRGSLGSLGTVDGGVHTGATVSMLQEQWPGALHVSQRVSAPETRPWGGLSPPRVRTEAAKPARPAEGPPPANRVRSDAHIVRQKFKLPATQQTARFRSNLLQPPGLVGPPASSLIASPETGAGQRKRRMPAPWPRAELSSSSTREGSVSIRATLADGNGEGVQGAEAVPHVLQAVQSSEQASMGMGIAAGGSSLANRKTPALVDAARKLLVRWQPWWLVKDLHFTPDFCSRRSAGRRAICMLHAKSRMMCKPLCPYTRPRPKRWLPRSTASRLSTPCSRHGLHSNRVYISAQHLQAGISRIWPALALQMREMRLRELIGNLDRLRHEHLALGQRQDLILALIQEINNHICNRTGDQLLQTGIELVRVSVLKRCCSPNIMTLTDLQSKRGASHGAGQSWERARRASDGVLSPLQTFKAIAGLLGDTDRIFQTFSLGGLAGRRASVKQLMRLTLANYRKLALIYINELVSLRKVALGPDPASAAAAELRMAELVAEMVPTIICYASGQPRDFMTITMLTDPSNNFSPRITDAAFWETITVCTRGLSCMPLPGGGLS